MSYWPAISDRYKDLRSAQFDKKCLALDYSVYFMRNAKAKIPSEITKNMDTPEIKAFMEMHGYPFGFSLSPFAQLRYPPGLAAPIAPSRLKEKMIADNPGFTGKINEFNKMYLKHASGLLDMSASMFVSGHPMTHKMASDHNDLQELEKLRLENSELKKRIESLKHNKSEKNSF
jgi:hypothetical protein